MKNISNLYMKTKLLEKINFLDEDLKNYFMNQISLVEAGKGEAVSTGFDMILQAAKRAEAEAAAAKAAGKPVDAEAIIKKVETPPAQTIPTETGVAKADTPAAGMPAAKAVETSVDAATNSKRAADNQLFRQGEAESMSKLEKMKDVGKKVAVPAAVAATALALSSDSKKDQQPAAAAEPPKPAEAPKADTSYEVKKGDNLWNIVKGRGKDMTNQEIDKEVKRISSLNKMKNPDLIMPGQKINFEETDNKLNGAMLAAFNDVINSNSTNLFSEAAKKNAKKLDPVGKEDEDIDNDGDKDKTDSYLHNRRKAIAKSMKEEDASIFSEKELAFLEGMAIAPTPEDQAPTPTPKNKAEGGKGKGSLAEARGRPPKEEGLGANELHMNAKRAIDNMANVTHKFANGEKVKMTKGMGVAFMNRHAAAKTADDKDAILNYAHQSPENFERVSKGGAVPKTESPAQIKLGSMKGK